MKGGSLPEKEGDIYGSTNWTFYRDDDGGTYYYNVETEETRWDMPEEVLRLYPNAEAAEAETAAEEAAAEAETAAEEAAAEAETAAEEAADREAAWEAAGIPADFPQGKDKSWGIMDKTELQSAITLGWSKKSWDAGERDQLMRHWEFMESREKDAAINLGFKETDFVVPEGKEPYTPQVPAEWVPSMDKNKVLYFTNIHNGIKIESALIDNMEIVGTDWEQYVVIDSTNNVSLRYINVTKQYDMSRSKMLHKYSDILVMADNMMITRANTREKIIADKRYTSLIDNVILLEEKKARLEEMESRLQGVGSGDTDTEDESLAWLVDTDTEDGDEDLDEEILKGEIRGLEAHIQKLRTYFFMKGFAEVDIDATVAAAVKNYYQQKEVAKSVQESKRAERKAAKDEREAAEEAKRKAEEAEREAAAARREAEMQAEMEAREAERKAAKDEREAAEEAKRKAEEAEREAAIEDEDLLGTKIYYYSKSTGQRVRAKVTKYRIDTKGTKFLILYEVSTDGTLDKRKTWITKSELIQAKEAEDLMGTEIYYYSKSAGKKIPAEVTKYRIDTEGTKFLISYEVLTTDRTSNKRLEWITKEELESAERPPKSARRPPESARRSPKSAMRPRR